MPELVTNMMMHNDMSIGKKMVHNKVNENLMLKITVKEKEINQGPITIINKIINNYFVWTPNFNSL